MYMSTNCISIWNMNVQEIERDGKTWTESHFLCTAFFACPVYVQNIKNNSSSSSNSSGNKNWIGMKRICLYQWMCIHAKRFEVFFRHFDPFSLLLISTLYPNSRFVSISMLASLYMVDRFLWIAIQQDFLYDATVCCWCCWNFIIRTWWKVFIVKIEIRKKSRV